MSQEGKAIKKTGGIEQFTSRIEELKLSRENELRVKSLFHTYSEKINYSKVTNTQYEVEFKQFNFFPGVVLVLDSEFDVIFQNRPIHGLEISSGKYFAGLFNQSYIKNILEAIEIAEKGKIIEAFYINDIEGNCYECNVTLYESDRKLFLIFLYQDNHTKALKQASNNIFSKSVVLLENSNLPIKFYFAAKEGFIPISRLDIFEETQEGRQIDHFIDPISDLTFSMQKKMKEAITRGVIRIENKVNGNDRKIFIPLSADYICVVSESGEDSIQSVTANELIDRYKIIANSFTDLFFILDNDLRFTFIAPSIQEALDYEFQELIGKGFDSLIPKWSGHTLKSNLISTANSGAESVRKITMQLSGKYGALKWYEVQITSIYNKENELHGYNGICRDITERLKYEEALMQSKQQAEESDKLKSAFLANMSHEIRTPLNGIIGFSTMMNNQKLPDDKKKKYLNFIKASSKQLLTLINDIIDISKIEAEQLSIMKTKIDLHKVLQELYATIQVEQKHLKKTGVALKLSIPDKEELVIYSDEVRFKQVFINLLSNALKFTIQGTVEFGYTINEDLVRFYVKDTGMGIPVEIQKLVFERFRQGNINEHAKITGTGLGLAISKGIIELLGGQVGLNSEKEIGSEFYFTFQTKTILHKN